LPIRNIAWGPRRGLDMHIVRGQSTPTLLTRHLFFLRQDGTVVTAFSYLFDPPAPGDVTVRFTAQIQGHQSGNTFHGAGVEIDTLTGIVRATDLLPPIRLHNFILVVQVTNLPDHKVFNLPIRIHIHDSVSQVWLTPDTLTIRPNGTTRPDNTGYRFSIRAQFDDGVVGDLTDTRGVTWACATNPANVDAEGWITLVTGDDPGDNLSITASLPATMGGATTPPGRVIIAQPWDDPTMATIIAAGGWPGKADPNTVPNFLFLCDGFSNTDDDKHAFETASNSIVNRFKTNHLTAPFDLLTTSINFWRCFIPSSRRGISIQCEVFTIKSDQGDVFGLTVPNPKPPPAAGPWGLDNLVYAVGLPVPRDARSNTARSNHDILTDWAVLFTPDPTPHVTEVLINRWRLMANRSLVEDVDSALGMAYGTLPQVDKPSDNSLIDFHFNRMTRARLNSLLATLHADPGFDLSRVWAVRDNQPPPSNFDFVFITSMSLNDRAQNANGYITFSVDEANYLAGITTAPGRNAYIWDPPAIPGDISGPRAGRALHEIAHSFGLGDEYADIPGTFTLPEARLAAFANLQSEADGQPNGSLDGDQIKWNWFRARKGALITNLIDEIGDDHWKIPVDTGQGLQFAKGDPVIVRKRNYPRPLVKRPVQTVTRAPIDGFITVLRVEDRDANSVTVTGPIADVFAFGAGDVLYSPVVAPDSVITPIYPFAEMVAKNVKDHFNHHHVPLTAVPCDPNVANSDLQIPILDGILNLHISGIDLPSIIGVYHGGAHSPCGIFHPAGTCLMRGGGDYDTLQFCAVCRYVLVDIINPFKHSQNDREYAKIYPLK
jgi:IgA Peptidase M64